jgi:hypothetical protein
MRLPILIGLDNGAFSKTPQHKLRTILQYLDQLTTPFANHGLPADQSTQLLEDVRCFGQFDLSLLEVIGIIA